MSLTPEQLVEHLRYEVLMLGETRRKLNEEDRSDQIAANALMESFCIHARNLNEFFLEESRRPDALKASNFATADYRVPDNTPIRRSIFAKINKQISHITDERTAIAAEQIGDLEREQMYCFLFDDLRNFSEHVKPELRAEWRVAFRG